MNARMDYVFRLLTPHKRRLSYRQRTASRQSVSASESTSAATTQQAPMQSLHFITLLELVYEICNDLATTTLFVTPRACRASAEAFLEQLERLDSVLGWMLIGDDNNNNSNNNAATNENNNDNNINNRRNSDFLVMNRQDSYVQMLNNLTSALSQSALQRNLPLYAYAASTLIERPCFQLYNKTTSLNRITIDDYEKLLDGENDCLGYLSPNGLLIFESLKIINFVYSL